MKNLEHLHLLKSKLIVILCLLFPLQAFAHLISISVTQPFPVIVNTGAYYTASFVVTNVSKINVTAVNESHFPVESGISISGSSCGALLRPSESCSIQLTLNAPIVAGPIATALKIWAKPSADGVQYPININVIGIPEISLVKVSSGGLPAFRDPVVAMYNGNWLIVSGTSGSFHEFDYNYFNSSIYVYNPKTRNLYSLPISSIIWGDPTTTNLVKLQLASSDVEYLQDGDTLYLIGGLNTIDNTTFTTLKTVTAINVPGMMNAIINGSLDLSSYVNSKATTNPDEFKVTGGQLGKINDNYYLVFGQDCEVVGQQGYCTPQYTNSIYQISLDPELSNISILDSKSKTNSSWRRRDYTLASFMLGNTQSLLALGGPFTPGATAYVWTDAISITENLQDSNNFATFLDQKGNQYEAPFISMYSSSTQFSYLATFGGLSNLYWTTQGLVYNWDTNYGNILDLITRDASGDVQEYVHSKPLCSGQPLSNCLYMGLLTKFIPVNNYFDSRYILQLDQLPKNKPTLVGYLYGGLNSPSQVIFPNQGQQSPAYATNAVYEVYVTLNNPVSPWNNVSNFIVPPK